MLWAIYETSYLFPIAAILLAATSVFTLNFKNNTEAEAAIDVGFAPIEPMRKNIPPGQFLQRKEDLLKIIRVNFQVSRYTLIKCLLDKYPNLKMSNNVTFTLEGELGESTDTFKCFVRT